MSLFPLVSFDLIDLSEANSSVEVATDLVGPQTVNVYVSPGASTQGNVTVQINTTLAP